MTKLLTFLSAFVLAGAAWASPGAHGPNGEHLDAPAAAGAGASAPRIETFTENYELVGTLSGGESSVLIDRYETNEPVLNGRLEVEYKGTKAAARFHADIGDYAIDDPRLLQALALPGKHALLFTFIDGADSDLLEGTLEVAPASQAQQPSRPAWPWLAAAGLALGGLAAWFARRGQKVTP